MPSTLPVAHVSLIFENPLWSTEKNFIGSSGTYCTFNVTIATWEYLFSTDLISTGFKYSHDKPILLRKDQHFS